MPIISIFQSNFRNSCTIYIHQKIIKKIHKTELFSAFNKDNLFFVVQFENENSTIKLIKMHVTLIPVFTRDGNKKRDG